MFSKACEYGIKAVIYIANRSMEGERVKIGDIAEHTGSPVAFTSKILSALTKHNIVQSVKGPYGGFSMSESRMKDVRISQIVAAIDGDSIYKGCALGFKECNSDQPCPLHDRFLKVRNDLKTMLETTSVHELATQLQTGKTTLMG